MKHHYGESPEQAEERRIREARIEQLQSLENRCVLCDYTGLITTEKLVGQSVHRFGFQCPKCEVAELKRLSKLIPTWNDQPGFKILVYPKK